jgi:hypothetical protein
MIPEVAERYLGDRKARQLFEIWKPNRQARTVKRGYTLRIQVPVPFRLHWSANEWQSVEDSPSSAAVLGFILSIFRSLLRNKRRFVLLFIGRSRIAGKVGITWWKLSELELGLGRNE